MSPLYSKSRNRVSPGNNRHNPGLLYNYAKQFLIDKIIYFYNSIGNYYQ